ncbi:hypothetical protein [Sorangium cellulosum]|uniref:hypothetical protein n=1 Tax=Sorangium cellulosum TaxID=56 RepID=UPI0012DB2F71|nr:hypothetical protein [Sorangium cellulosum]
MSKFMKEMAAAQSLTRLLDAAEECLRAHDAAGMKYPEPLLRMLGEEEAPRGGEKGRQCLVIPAPQRPPAPPEADDGWIWVEITAMKASNLTLGVLRGARKPMTPSEISEALGLIGVEVSRGTIGNIGTRLFGSHIRRLDDGWVLVEGATSPVLFQGFAWGPHTIFEATELAAHRRAGIVHLLRVQPDGMQMMQIAHTLAESCPWNKAPVNKDLVKADMEALDELGLAKRMAGNSGKWRAA